MVEIHPVVGVLFLIAFIAALISGGTPVVVSVQVPPVIVTHNATCEPIAKTSEAAPKQAYSQQGLHGCKITPLFYNQTKRDYSARSSGGLKKYLSFSVYGTTPRYTIGAIKNAKLASEVYPDWNTRFYVDASVSLGIVASLIQLNAEVYFVNSTEQWCSGMYWRFFIWDDEDTVDLFQVRDTDCRLASRDKLAVEEWITDGTAFHLMRDHPSHSESLVSGGLWGARTSNRAGQGQWRVSEAVRDFAAKRGRWNYRQDMDFLDSLWSALKQNLTQHDSFSCVRHGGKGFPSRPTSERFVGERLDENDKPHEGDLALYRAAKAPKECIRGE